MIIKKRNMIIINFKNYKTGPEALKLAKTIEKYLPRALIAAPTIDIETIKSRTKLTVIAQHADSEESNRATGYNTLEALKKAGVKGTLINHSEHPLSLSKIYIISFLSKKLKLKTIICTPSLRDAKSILNNKKVRPYAIAFEDPKLISTGKSITKYNPKALLQFIKIIKKTKIVPVCGAGISTAEDVKQAYAFGCKGVLIASAIANAKNPIPLLKQLREFQ